MKLFKNALTWAEGARGLVIQLTGVGLVLVLSSGCVNTSLSADSDPTTDLDSLRKLYVVRQVQDERGIERLIADELQDLGFQAEYGEEQAAPKSVDALITYQDRWMWDITIYMLELKIQVRDPGTQYIMASGETYRSSLARKAPEIMVQEVIAELYRKNRIMRRKEK